MLRHFYYLALAARQTAAEWARVGGERRDFIDPILVRISHTFFQNKREAADFLSFPYFGEKQSVCGAC